MEQAKKAPTDPRPRRPKAFAPPRPLRCLVCPSPAPQTHAPRPPAPFPALLQTIATPKPRTSPAPPAPQARPPTAPGHPVSLRPPSLTPSHLVTSAPDPARPARGPGPGRPGPRRDRPGGGLRPRVTPRTPPPSARRSPSRSPGRSRNGRHVSARRPFFRPRFCVSAPRFPEMARRFPFRFGPSFRRFQTPTANAPAVSQAVSKRSRRFGPQTAPTNDPRPFLSFPEQTTKHPAPTLRGPRPFRRGKIPTKPRTSRPAGRLGTAAQIPHAPSPPAPSGSQGHPVSLCPRSWRQPRRPRPGRSDRSPPNGSARLSFGVSA